MFYADTLGLQTVVAGIERFGCQLGMDDWTPAELLLQLAARGENFADYDNITREGVIRDTTAS